MKCLITNINDFRVDDSFMKVNEGVISGLEFTTPSDVLSVVISSITEDLQCRIYGKDAYILKGDNKLQTNTIYKSQSDSLSTTIVKNPASSDVKVFFRNKNDVDKFFVSLSSISVPIENFAQFQNVKSIGISVMSFDKMKYVYGDIAYLSKLKKLKYVHLNSTSIYGDISVFQDKTDIKELNLSYATNVYGDITNLGKLIKCDKMYLSDTGISGTLESLLQSLQKNNKQDGSLIIHAKRTGVTYNGEPVTTAYAVTFKSDGYDIETQN